VIGEITFATLGGTQRAAVDTPADAPRGVVVVAPALGVRESDYRKLCGALNGQGFATAAVDLPGHGDSPVRANRRRDWGYASVIEHDASAPRALRRQAQPLAIRAGPSRISAFADGLG